MIITILVFLLILSVLVLIHELGHFIVAKKFGIKVEEFGFGFPPKLWGIKKGETTYSVNWLPIGGFVKLYGEDEAGGGRLKTQNKELKTKDVKRAFFARPVGQRAAVVIAGVVMNTILAIIIFYAFLGISNFKTSLPLLGQHEFLLVNQKTISEVIVTAVSKNSPAEKAGVTPYSKIVSINGQPVTNTQTFVQTINKNRGSKVILAWEDARTSKKSQAQLIPRISPPKNEGALGIAFFPLSTVVLTYDSTLQKVLSGVSHPLNLMLYNFSVIGKLIGISVEQKNIEPVAQGVSGPVGIAYFVGDIVQIPDIKERILKLLNLAGTLSISLAIFNVLPIPALDGGRLFFILIEAITGRKVSQKIEGYAHTIGFAILLALIFLITFKDVSNIFTGKFPGGP